MDWLSLASLAIAGAALAVSIAMAVRGDRRAARAEGRAERAEARAVSAETKAEQMRLGQLWSDLVKQVQPWLNVNVTAVDLGKPLTALRTAAVELVDAAPREAWPELDAWLNAEHMLGTSLAHSTLERMETVNPRDVDAIVAAHDDLHQWAYAFLLNIRRLRNAGPSSETSKALAALRRHADQQTAAVCERHGWPLPQPPDRVKPLDLG